MYNIMFQVFNNDSQFLSYILFIAIKFWLYSLCCTMYLCNIFIHSSLYLIIPYPYPVYPISLPSPQLVCSLYVCICFFLILTSLFYFFRLHI